MYGQLSEEKIAENLKDAGCDRSTIQKFLQLHEEGNRQEQLRLLSRHRISLLDTVHVSQQRIDCLDYLIYTLKKGGGAL